MVCPIFQVNFYCSEGQLGEWVCVHLLVKPCNSDQEKCWCCLLCSSLSKWHCLTNTDYYACCSHKITLETLLDARLCVASQSQCWLRFSEGLKACRCQSPLQISASHFKNFIKVAMKLCCSSGLRTLC